MTPPSNTTGGSPAVVVPRNRLLSTRRLSYFWFGLVGVATTCWSPSSYMVHAGRPGLPQGDQSTLLCRCQAVWEDLYRNDRRSRALLLGYRPFQMVMNMNSNNNRNMNRKPKPTPKRANGGNNINNNRQPPKANNNNNPPPRVDGNNNAQVDRNGYIIVDGLTVLPDTRPVCAETRQRKRQAGVRHLLEIDGEDEFEDEDSELIDEAAEIENWASYAEDFDDDHGHEEGHVVDATMDQSHVQGAIGRLRPPNELPGRRNLKGSKGGGKGKGGGSKGGGSKGGSDDWGWGKGKGGGSKGSKGGSDDWGWGKGKGGGSKGSPKMSKGGGMGKGKGKGNDNWRPPVFPCPRPPKNNNRPTRAPASEGPTSRITLEPTLSFSPTNVPSSNIIAPTVSPNPTGLATPRPSEAIPLEPTRSPAGTAEPTASLEPTGGGTPPPSASLQPTDGGGSTPAPSPAGTAEPTASLQPTGSDNTPAPSPSVPTPAGTAEPTITLQPTTTIPPTFTAPTPGGTPAPTTTQQPTGTGNTPAPSTAEPTSSLQPTGSGNTPAPSPGGTAEPTTSLRPTGLSPGTAAPSQAIPVPPTTTLQPTGGGTPAPSQSRAPTGPPVTGVPTITGSPTTTVAPTQTASPTITGQPSQGPSVTAAPSTSSAPSGVTLQRAFNSLFGNGKSLWKSSADTTCELSLGLRCSTSQGKACSELYYPATMQCPTFTQVATFRFDPSSCSTASANGTGVTCKDFGPLPDGDFLVQCQSSRGNVLEVSPIIVTPGDTFTVQLPSGRTLPPAFECTVSDARGVTVQTIGLDPGVSASSMSLKRRIGSLTLEGCDDVHCLETLRYRYEVKNDGGGTMTVTSLTARQNGGINYVQDLTNQLPVKRLEPSDVGTAEGSHVIDMCVLRTYETTIRAKGSPYPDNGKVCVAQRVFELEIGPPPATS